MPAGNDRRLLSGLGVAGIVGIGIFAGAAILALALASAGGVEGASGGPSGMGLFDAYVWRVARFTLLQAGLSTLLSLVPAVPVRWRSPGGVISQAGSGWSG